MDIVALILEILLALMFLLAGSTKVIGSKNQVETFNHLKLPQWFRVVTGLVQYIGAFGLIVGIWIPSWAAWAGIGFGVMMLVAVASHVRAKDSLSQSAPAVVLLIMAVIIVLIQSPEITHFPG